MLDKVDKLSDEEIKKGEGYKGWSVKFKNRMEYLKTGVVKALEILGAHTITYNPAISACEKGDEWVPALHLPQLLLALLHGHAEVHVGSACPLSAVVVMRRGGGLRCLVVACCQLLQPVW